MYKMSNGNLNIKNKFQRDKKQLIADVILWIIMCIIYIAFWKQNLMYLRHRFIPSRIVIITFLFIVGSIGILIKDKIPQKYNTIVSFLFVILSVPYNFVMLEYTSHHRILDFSINKIMANLIIISIIVLIIFAITNSFKGTIIGINIISVVFGLVYYYVIKFRGTAVLAVDIFSATTAANVAGNYNYRMSYRCYLFVILTYVLSIYVLKLDRHNLFNGKKRLISVGIAILAVVCGFSLFIQSSRFDNSLKIKMFKPQESYRKYGDYLTFTHSIRYIKGHKPEGYSEDKVEQISAQYPGIKGNGKKPNIIMIMNEALADFSSISDIETNEDYMPFIHGLTENTVKGDLFVSIFGGGTSKTEYEALTSNSMAFMPKGSTPYVTYINRKTSSLATNLRAQGYGGMVAMHPYKGSGYKRNKVYPLLGFDKFYDLPEFNNAKVIRNHVSDEGNFDKIIKVYEQNRKKDKKPFFLFDVTMQNHSSYDRKWDNLSDDISTIKDYGDDVNIYLNLVKASDDAFKKLVEYFSNVDEPTMIIMFGDHQPKLNNHFYENVEKGFSLGDEYKMFEKYNTPFVIWANYDIEEQTDVKISANYMGTMIDEIAGNSMSGYQQMVNEIRKDIPIITAGGYIGADGKYYHTFDKSSPYYDKIMDYCYSEYNNVFDKKHLVDEFFKINDNK
ncbi:LTA synthase family protein [Eubacterium sp. AF19-12LB]|uniref:LTA synthase family protein n=1 Tax=Eubacterium sp. AF19-12LB TaxID=2293106 RepID=UPI000E54F7BB|nr:LTA synthase family protein [Eubacterium sp. AF19-12LB]RHR34653.1 LTA synthase family protein [Eubacterium sp. AF19-12LB]